MKGLTLKKWERRVWDYYEMDEAKSVGKYCKAMHTYNQLLSRKLELIDIVRPEEPIQRDSKGNHTDQRLWLVWQNWQPLYVGENENGLKPIDLIPLDDELTIEDLLNDFDFNPKHPTIIELQYQEINKL